MANIVEQDSVAKVTNTIIDVSSKSPIIQLKTNIVFESETVEPIDAIARKLNANNNETTKMSVKFRTGVPAADNKVYEFTELNMKSKSKSVCCATRINIENADNVLEGMVYNCLLAPQKEKLDEIFR